MTISQTMNARLNDQVTHEFHASHLYLSMACMFEAMSLRQLAKVFRKQAEEERSHALKIVDFLLEAQGKVTLKAIPEPTADWPSVLAAIEAAAEHEKKVTRQIHELVAQAEQDKDYASRAFLQWFVTEQVEEIDLTTYLVDLAKMAGPKMLMLEGAVSHLAK